MLDTKEELKVCHRMERIPIDVLSILSSYLSRLDYLYFLNTSKQLFYQLKARSCRYKLRPQKSWDFLTDSGFRSYFLSKMEQPRAQLSLNLFGKNLSSLLPLIHNHTEILPVFKLLCDCSLFDEEHRDLPSLPQIEWCNHTQSELGHIQISQLRGNPAIQSLNLSFFLHLSCLINFSSLRELELFDCPSLYEIPHFPHLVRVRLSYCDGITDLRPIRDVRSVTLRNCQNIHDLSPLQSNDDVTVIECRGVKSYTNCLKKSRNVSVNYKSGKIDINDISLFPEVRRLGISSSNTLTSLNPPSFLMILTLIHCSNLTDITALKYSRLKKISFNGCYEVKDLSPLSLIPIIDLAHMRISSLEGLGRHHAQVTVQYCPFIEDFSPLNIIERVSVIGCVGFTRAKELKDVRCLTIQNCIRINDVSMLGEVKQLSLIACNNINSLRGLGNVPELFIGNCVNLRSIKGLGNNHMIILHHTMIEDHFYLLNMGYSSDVRADRRVYMKNITK